MSLANLLSQFTAPSGNQSDGATQGGNPLSALTSALPGGLAGGAAAGGVVALLMGSKSARKMAGSAAKIGGTALLGGLAYKAFSSWKENRPLTHTQTATAEDIERAQSAMPAQSTAEPPIQVTLVKAMISAAKSDGHIDPSEQKSIYEALERMDLTHEDKAAVFDAMSREISVQEIASAIKTDEHKAEVYLSAYLAIDVDNEKERKYLNSLALALELPPGLSGHLEQQVHQGYQ